MASCNICGNTEFGVGPGGRLSSAGQLPCCRKCGSLERHRTYRALLVALKSLGFVGGSAIQFSPDRSVEPSWFKEYEVSIYGGSNSLDLQKIDRQSDAYDFVMCNHVLEHVCYDNSALNELVRISKDTGYVFLAVPAPLQSAKTRDWGFAKEDQHGHYRIYGRDFSEILQKYLPNCHFCFTDQPDPVTEMPERVYLISKSRDVIERIRTSLASNTSIELMFPTIAEC